MIYKKGFTLVELLVTIAILGMLATFAMGQYKTSQMKARDAQRKTDLSNIARALEMYYNDNGRYPDMDNTPYGEKMVIDNGGTPVTLDWGGEFSTDRVLYMKVLPQDPLQSNGWLPYCYIGLYNSSNGHSEYHLYAYLENENDLDTDLNKIAEGEIPATSNYVCGSGLDSADYNYGVASPNVDVYYYIGG